ncbi:MAG: radical SAM protein [Oscillospiraceae bacterium]|jgi:putative pyruvate formate lyase activating enzyme|nr:radical SAM protein [Oscillospiraceae bacterium]
MRIEHCELCPRRCGALREAREGNGFCRMGADPVVARAALHFWEEPCLSGTRGSGAVFFTGCSLQCVFCQNYEISTQRNSGKVLTAEELSSVFRRLVEQGALNINLVTAAHFVPAVREALLIWKPPVPVVYNCGGYETLETLRMLEGLVDIYLPDLKYADDGLAFQLSGAKDYVDVSRAAVLEMVRQTGPAVYGEGGIMQRGTLVRHLILPGHTKDSCAVLDWVQANLPGVPVSLMAQYVPCGLAEKIPGLNRRITQREYQKVQDHLFSLNLEGYVQERKSASKEFIPSFDMKD